jgi:hypothetical protein
MQSDWRAGSWAASAPLKVDRAARTPTEIPTPQYCFIEASPYLRWPRILAASRSSIAVWKSTMTPAPVPSVRSTFCR